MRISRTSNIMFMYWLKYTDISIKENSDIVLVQNRNDGVIVFNWNIFEVLIIAPK